MSHIYLMVDRSADAHSDSTVFVVADEGVSDRYADWLREHWSVETASGPAAMPSLESEPAVVVLDRDVSGVHADRLLGVVHEREFDTRVLMLTSVEPGPEPVKLGFDDHLVKPVSGDELVGAVRRALRRAAYQRRVSEFYELAARQASLDEGPATAEQRRRLRAELADARAAVSEAFARLEDDDVAKLCDELSRRDPPDDVLPEL